MLFAKHQPQCVHNLDCNSDPIFLLLGGNKSTQRRNSGGARQHQWTQKKANTVGDGGGSAANDRNRKPSERGEGGGGAADAKKVGRSRENSAKDSGKKVVWRRMWVKVSMSSLRMRNQQSSSLACADYP